MVNSKGMNECSKIIFNKILFYSNIVCISDNSSFISFAYNIILKLHSYFMLLG